MTLLGLPLHEEVVGGTFGAVSESSAVASSATSSATAAESSVDLVRSIIDVLSNRVRCFTDDPQWYCCKCIQCASAAESAATAAATGEGAGGSDNAAGSVIAPSELGTIGSCDGRCLLSCCELEPQVVTNKMCQELVNHQSTFDVGGSPKLLTIQNGHWSSLHHWIF